MTAGPADSAAARSRPTRTPVIIGFLVAGAAILGVSFFVSSLERDDAYDNVPPISIAAPASGDTLTNPVTLVFHTPGQLQFDSAMGWMARDLHLHTMVGSLELMPGAGDILVTDSAYTWHLPRLGAGTHRLYMTWAGRHHGNLRGETDTIVIHVAR